MLFWFKFAFVSHLNEFGKIFEDILAKFNSIESTTKKKEKKLLGSIWMKGRKSKDQHSNNLIQHDSGTSPASSRSQKSGNMHNSISRMHDFFFHCAQFRAHKYNFSLTSFGNRSFIRVAFQTKNFSSVSVSFILSKKKASDLQQQIVRSDLKRKDLWRN